LRSREIGGTNESLAFFPIGPSGGRAWEAAHMESAEPEPHTVAV